MNAHVGKIGARRTFYLKYIDKYYPSYTDAGFRCLCHVFIDAESNRIEWQPDRRTENETGLKYNHLYSLQATVADHKDINGLKVTVIQIPHNIKEIGCTQ